MIRNGYNKNNVYQNKVDQTKIKTRQTNFAKTTSPILTHQENNYFYNAKINRIIFQEINAVNKVKPIKEPPNKPIRSIYKAKNNSQNLINKCQKLPETKHQNVYQAINDSQKNLKESSSYIIDTNKSGNSYYYSNIKFLPNTNMNDYNKLKKINNVGNYSKKCLNNGINNQNSNNGIKITLKSDINNYYNKKEIMRKISINSKKNNKFKIYNNELSSKINDISYYTSSTNDKVFKNKNMSTNYSNNSKKSSNKKCYYKNKINNSVHIINVYDRKNNSTLNKKNIGINNSNKILTNSNSNNDIYIKFETRSYQEILNENLTIFCEKIENFYLDSFKKFFSYFINNLKQYQNNNMITNRSLLLKRLCENKKSHHHPSMSNNYEQIKNKYENKNYICKSNKTNNTTNKIDDFQKKLINSMKNVNQDNYIQVFNELFNKPMNHQVKRARSPLPDSNYNEIKINFDKEKNKNLNRSIGEEFFNNYNSKTNNFRNYCSPSGNIFSKYKSSYNFENNLYNKNNNDINIVKNNNDDNTIQNRLSVNRSFDCNHTKSLTMKNNRNYKNDTNSNYYVNSECFDRSLNNFSSIEDDNKKYYHLINDIDKNKTFRNDYKLNSSNIYTKPVLKKTTTKTEEELSKTPIKKNTTIYEAKTFINLPRKNSQDNVKNVLKSNPNEQKSKKNIDIKNNQLKEKVIKNVSTKDQRLHVYIKYIFYRFNRQNKKSFKELNPLKLSKKDKNTILNKFPNTSFDISKYIVKHNVSITLLSEINNNSDNEVLKEKDNYFLNAITFLTDLLQYLYNDNKKLMLFNFIKNMRKIRNNKLLHQSLMTHKNKIKSTRTKTNSEVNFNGNNILSNFRPSTNVSSSNNDHNSDSIQNIPNKKYKDNNYFNLTAENSFCPPTKSIKTKENYSDGKENINDYHNRTIEIKKNICVTETKPLIKLKKINKKLIYNNLNNNNKNVDEDKEQKLEKLKKMKLSKLFNNLDQENNIINTIKNQFLDWTSKNNKNNSCNFEQYNNDDNKYERKTFDMARQPQKIEEKEKYGSIEVNKINKYDKNNYGNDENYEIKKESKTFIKRKISQQKSNFEENNSCNDNKIREFKQEDEDDN